MPKNSRIKLGFTLTEVVIAIFIVTLLVAMSGAMIGLTGRANTESVNTSAATSIAQNKIEEMRNTDFDSISNHTFTNKLPENLPYPRSAQAVVTEVRPNVKRIEVIVTYGGVEDRYITLVSKNGISK